MSKCLRADRSGGARDHAGINAYVHYHTLTRHWGARVIQEAILPLTVASHIVEGMWPSTLLRGLIVDRSPTEVERDGLPCTGAASLHEHSKNNTHNHSLF